MTYDRRKIANSFFLPKRPILRGMALMDFTGSITRDYHSKFLIDLADVMRAD